MVYPRVWVYSMPTVLHFGVRGVVGELWGTKVHTAFQQPFGPIWTIVGDIVGIISNVPTHFGPEKAKRLRSSVYLGLRAPTARDAL